MSSQRHSVLTRFLTATLCLLTCLLSPLSHAAEESAFNWPLGPLGGKFRIWTDSSYIRVVELTANAPGATNGLKVNDFITGAFGRDFDPISPSKFNGPVRQLGNAIDYAEFNNTPLILQIIRPGTGPLTLNIPLPATSGLNANFTRNSTRYDALYESACAALHSRIMATSNGDIGYPTGFAGLALLGHPNWNDSSSAKPYRLSINKIRDWALDRIRTGILTPVENNFLDGTANPNYSNPGLENWTLGQAVMFLSEYISKTNELSTYQTDLDRAATMMANRIQNWKQPDGGGSTDRSFENCRGATSHGGVVGDYTHLFTCGINMAGVHLFNGLAMAKRAGANMSLRPKDGHYFGLSLNPGDPIPATVADALPATITLPRGAQDSRSLPHIDNTSAAPLTKIITASTSNNPFYYDFSLDQKFWTQWEYLRRTTTNAGYVTYAVSAGAEYDAGGRTPASFLGMKVYSNNATLAAEDQDYLDRQLKYIVNAHDIHLNCHTYNMGGTCFTALMMPFMADRDQRFFLENWKFFYNLAGQPDGSIQYFRGRDFADAYIDSTDAMHTNVALAGSVARGGLPHIPGFDTNRIMTRVRKPLMEWPSPDARLLKLPTGSTATSFELDVINGTGSTLASSSLTAKWSVVSGPVTTGIIANPNILNASASFPQPGTYRLRVDVTSGSLTTYDQFDVKVQASPIAGYLMGEADYKVYTNLSGTSVADLTAAPSFPNSPNLTQTLTQLEGTYSDNNFGASVTGVIVPPVTGTYRFYIASDDASELRFNPTGPSASGATTIASVATYTNYHNWTQFPSQQSAQFTLTAGQPYYIQALHKEGGGGEHVSIAWTTPSNSTITLIGSESIARPNPNTTTPNPAILTQPSAQSANMGGSITLAIEVVGPKPYFFQWRRNGVNFGAPQDSPSLTLTNVSAALAGQWDCIFTSGNTALTSQAAAVTILDAGISQAGGLWQEVFTNVSGSSIDNLVNAPNFPLLPTTSALLTETHTASFDDNYGQRWSGWIIPTTTARYRFYSAADDSAQLFLSPTPYESHKSLIHAITSTTGEMQWSARPPSDWFTLEAGKRYYVELLHKEGGGGDHAAFTWQREGDPTPTNGSSLIPAVNLACITGGVRPDAHSAPPVAFPDTISLLPNTSASLDVLANDADASNASLTLTSFTQPSFGSVTQSGRSLTFTPPANTTGKTSFSYTIRNAIGLSSTTTVSIDVIQTRITTQPLSQSAAIGDTVTFSISTVSLNPGTYQWRLNGNPYGSSSNSPTLTLTNISAFLAGSWDCQFSADGQTLTSQSASLSIPNLGSTTTGGLWQEFYGSVSGNNIEDLLIHPNFPTYSTRSGVIPQTSTASLGDNYGQRWSGWLVPSVSGRYRFYSTGDDKTQLYLSPSAYQAHRQLILSLTSYTTALQWSSRAPSAWFQLEAGQRYFVEFFHKEGGGGDHAAFTWQREGDPTPTNGSSLIPSANLMYAIGGTMNDTATAPPLAVNDSIQTFSPTVMIDVLANDVDADPSSLTLTSFTQPTQGDVRQIDRQLCFTAPVGFKGSSSFTYTIRNRVNQSATATVTITTSSLSDSLLAWWKFDENTGTSAADSSGNNNTATLTGATWTTPKVGTAALATNGTTTQYAQAPSLTTPNGFTICAWIKPTNVTGYHTILAEKDCYAFRTTDSSLNLVTPAIRDHNSSGLTLQAGVWQHVAISFQPNTTGGAKFYLNGTLMSSTDASNLAASTNLTQIGRTQNWSGQDYFGAIDDLRVYSGICSPSAIAAIAANPTPPSFVQSPLTLDPATEDAPYSTNLRWSAIDANTDAIQFSKDSGPAWLTIDANGNASGTPTNNDVGSNSFTLKATDSSGLSATTSMTLNVINVNDPPSFSSSSLTRTNATSNTPYSAPSLATDASDPDLGDSLTFSKSAGPAWLQVATDGSLSGTPSYIDLGDQTFSITATDSHGVSTTATLTIRVSNPLLAWWKFDENTGTSAADSSGNNHTATLTGATWSSPFTGTSSLTFNGTTQYAQAPSLTPTTALTIMAWIKPTNLTGYRTIVAEKNAYALRLNGTSLNFNIPSVKDYNATNLTLTANTWQHVAITFTPNTTNGLKFYLNGILTSSLTTTSLPDTTNLTDIARNQNYTNQNFLGAIDDLRIFNANLDATSINSLIQSWPQWQIANFSPTEITAGTAADLADPDHDGLSNLLEYALGSNPKSSSPLTSPTIENGKLGFTFTRTSFPADVTLDAQASETLKAWSPATIRTLSTSGNSQTLRAEIPTSPNGRMFIRLRATR